MEENHENIIEGKWMPLWSERRDAHGSWAQDTILCTKKLLWDFVSIQNTGHKCFGKLIRVDDTTYIANTYIFSADSKELQVLDRSEFSKDEKHRVVRHDADRVYLYDLNDCEYRLLLQKIVPARA